MPGNGTVDQPQRQTGASYALCLSYANPNGHASGISCDGEASPALARPTDEKRLDLPQVVFLSISLAHLQRDLDGPPGLFNIEKKYLRQKCGRLHMALEGGYGWVGR